MQSRKGRASEGVTTWPHVEQRTWRLVTGEFGLRTPGKQRDQIAQYKQYTIADFRSGSF